MRTAFRPDLRLMPLLLWLLFSLALIAPAGAQTPTDEATPVRRPLDLAWRFLGFSGHPPIVPPGPLYNLGDGEQFWVTKVGQDRRTEISATLVASAPSIYLWIEDGIPAEGTTIAALGQRLHQLLTLLRLRETYRPASLGEDAQILDPTDLLALPDIDGDQRLSIVFARDLAGDRDALYNPVDSLPSEIAPAGVSSQRDVILVNTSAYPDVPLTDPLYLNVLGRAFFQLIIDHNIDDQAPWLTDMLGQAVLLRLFGQTPSAADLGAYRAAPQTSLTRAATLGTAAPTAGGQQWFLAYLRQRLGPAPYSNLFLQSGGIDAIDSVIAAHERVDPASAAPLTARDLFIDFTIANIASRPFGDGRHFHRLLTPPEGASLALRPLASEAPISDSLLPFASAYFVRAPGQAAEVTLSFSTERTSARLPMPVDRDPADPFYWSGRAANSDATLTRAVDLRAVADAALTFDVWHDLAAGWNYAYVAVSEDQGATWDLLAASTTTRANLYGAAYGPGFTGISSAAGPRPFPIMGVIIGADGLTIGEVSAGGPAEAAGILPGDRIIGYEGQRWPGVPNVLALLGAHAPGDTLTLMIERGAERLNVPVRLGAHPTRVVQPQPVWQAQTVDLSAYADREILLRFERISLPGREDSGIAIDNIAIDALGFSDSADTDRGWTANGWDRVTNQVASRFAVSTLTTGAPNTPPRLRPLIAADSTAVSGEWQLALQQDEALLVIVSNVGGEYDGAAAYQLRSRP